MTDDIWDVVPFL